MAYPQTALDNVADVRRAVLVQLEVMAWSFLCNKDKNRTKVSGCAMGSGRNSEECSRTEDDDGNVDRAEDAELVCFFEEAVLALRRVHNTVSVK